MESDPFAQQPGAPAARGPTAYQPDEYAQGPLQGPSYRGFGGLQTALFALTIATLVASTLSNLFMPSMEVETTGSSADAAEGAMVAYLLLAGFVAMIAGGIALAQVIVGVIWMGRAYGNAQALGARGLSWSPGWAIGSWFIPFANLVIPFLIMTEIWKASDPRATEPEAWRSLPTPGWMIALWVLWVASFLVSVVLGFALAIGSALGSLSYLEQVLLNLPGVLLYLAAGVLFLNYVSKVHERQTLRAGQVPQSAPVRNWEAA